MALAEEGEEEEDVQLWSLSMAAASSSTARPITEIGTFASEF
jgi:hypothetical protein